MPIATDPAVLPFIGNSSSAVTSLASVTSTLSAIGATLPTVATLAMRPLTSRSANAPPAGGCAIAAVTTGPALAGSTSSPTRPSLPGRTTLAAATAARTGDDAVPSIAPRVARSRAPSAGAAVAPRLATIAAIPADSTGREGMPAGTPGSSTPRMPTVPTVRVLGSAGRAGRPINCACLASQQCDGDARNQAER